MTNPLKISWKTEIIPLIILIVSVIAGFFFYASFPDLVATHWNFYGRPDGYSDKAFAAFFFPGLLVAMYLLFLIVPYLDPKKERYAEFARVYNIFRHLLLLVLALLYLATGIYNLGYKINIGIFTAWLIGLLMIILGSYLDKLKPNWFIGIRTPWTLSSETVWIKTHKLGKILFIIFGLILIVIPYLPQTPAWILFLSWMIVLILGTLVYSYWLFYQETKKRP